MKQIIFLILCVVCSVNSYGQFYSIEKKRSVKNVEVVVSDTVREESFDDDLEESENIEETAKIPDTMKVSINAVLPLKKILITSPYGTRTDPLTKRKRQHKGVDLKARHEYPVAMMYGRVLRTGFDKRAGNFVTLQHGELTVSYCHLSKILVKKDDVVYAGTRIGLTGSTGRSTGEHLHLTIRIGEKLLNPTFLFKLIR